MHGLALIAHREYRRVAGEPRRGALPAFLATLGTFYWVYLAWIFFRARDMTAALTTVRKFLLLDVRGGESISVLDGAIDLGAIAFILALVATAHWAVYRLEHDWNVVPRWAFAGGVGFAIPFILAFVPSSAQPFIYFQF